MNTSPLFRLHLSDVQKGILMAFLAPALLQAAAFLNAVANNSSLPAFDWASLLKVSLASGVAYVLKNYFSDSHGNVLGIGSPKA